MVRCVYVVQYVFGEIDVMVIFGNYYVFGWYCQDWIVVVFDFCFVIYFGGVGDQLGWIDYVWSIVWVYYQFCVG